jgi:hypothetical protein
MTDIGAWKDMPTVDLVREAQQGRGDARDELFQRYSTRVLSVGCPFDRVWLPARLRQPLLDEYGA